MTFMDFTDTKLWYKAMTDMLTNEKNATEQIT